MSTHTLAEIRSNIANTTREKQINSLIDNFINLTINEINDFHLWTFNRRKTTFDTVATIEDYLLPRDLDKINFIRQTESPTKIRFVPDHLFLRLVPEPTATGDPHYYRLWEEEGISTSLAADGTIDAVSGSTSDGSSFTVSIRGHVGGYKDSEVLTLNGTTKVTGAKTFQTGYPVFISKSGKTTGKITITTGATTLLTMAPEERSARFKEISLYPIPDDAITIYLEYYTRLRELVNASDTPNIDEKWHWVVREGALAKVFQYQGEAKLNAYQAAEMRYQAGLRAMRAQDVINTDFIPMVRGHIDRHHYGNVVTFSNRAYGSYGLTY